MKEDGQRKNHAFLRDGFTVVESLVALAVLALVIVAVVQSSASLAHQRRNVGRYQLALDEAANTLEWLSTLAWDELTPERLARVELGEAAQRELPQGRLQVRVEETAELPARRLIVEIDWANAAGQRTERVRLVGWRFAREES